MRRTQRVQNQVESRVVSLCMKFEDHLAAFEDATPFASTQLRAHRRTIDLRMELEDLDRVLEDGEFFHSLRETLRQWDMDSRGARLGSEHDWLETFYTQKETLEWLWTQRLDDPSLDIEKIATDAWSILSGGRIMASKSQLVGGTKVLHHLLPNLIPPIDRRYTCSFFQWHGPQIQREPWDVFSDILSHSALIARDVQPGDYVGSGWNSSLTKVLDNAIVGYELQA